MKRSFEIKALTASIVRSSLSIAMCLVCLFFAVPHRLDAQIDVGYVTGTVKDSAGALIAGAKLTLTNDATGVPIVTQSSSTGAYVFGSVNPGVYTLRIEHAGFETQLTNNIQVHIQQTATLNIAMMPGKVTQQVSVVATTPLLQAQDASVGQTIDTKEINDLPLIGRDFISLAMLSAGVTTSASGTATGNPGGVTFNSEGVDYMQNDFRLNGIDNVLEIYGGSGDVSIQPNASIIPPPDALQEFKLANGDYSAEFGHSTGAVVNAVIKSGSNQLKGDLWEYLRNDAFDANDYFSNQRGVGKSEYRQNVFGGTVGGPITIPGLYDGRDKSFFFFDWQGNRIIEPVASTQTVPTALMVSSGFTNLQGLIAGRSGTGTDALGRVFPYGTVFDPATTRTVVGQGIDPISGLHNPSNSTIYVRDPFYNGSVYGVTNFTGNAANLNQLPANRLDPNAIKLLGLYPAATSSGLLNNYYYVPKESLNINSYDIRLDENIDPKNVIWGVYSQYNTYQVLPGSLPGIANGQVFGTGFTNLPYYAIALSYTHTYSPTLLNELHLGLDHQGESLVSPTYNQTGIPAEYGISNVPEYPGFNGDLDPISVGGFGALGMNSSMPTHVKAHSLEAEDTLTKLHASQTFTAGVQILSLEGNISHAPLPSFNFSGGFSDIPLKSTGYTGIADLLLMPQNATVPNGINGEGGVATLSGTSVSSYDEHRYYLGAYFQDDWKATPRLTLNLGLRWDFFTPHEEIHGREANFAPNGGNGPGGTYYLPNETYNTTMSPTFVPLLAANGIALKCVPGLGLGTEQKLNFAPRIGFAYHITQPIVLRAGYGIAYGNLDDLGGAPPTGRNYPFYYTLSYTAVNNVSPLMQPGSTNGATATLENALADINFENPALVNGNGVVLEGIQYDDRTPYTETFNVTLQDEFTRNDSIQAAYVATVGRQLDNIAGTNAPSIMLPPGTNYTNYLPFPSFSPGSSYVTSNATSDYNSLQVVYQHQFGYGLSALANYTYSKCMQDSNPYDDGVTHKAEWLKGFGLDGDWQLCPSDAKDVVHASGLYQLPFGRQRQWLTGNNLFLQSIAGGWNFNFIYTHQSGNPLTIGCPVATTAYFGCDANLVKGMNPYAGPHDQHQWLNISAFSQPPAAATVGQTDYSPLGSRPGQVRSPGFNNLDASLVKEFPINSQFHFELRGEAFNATNTVQFAPPGQLNFNNSTDFSEITALRNTPRIIQIALKLYY